MECPKCNVRMKVITREGVETDECPQCGGIWVDCGEEKQVMEMKPSVFTVEDINNLRKIYKPWPLGKLTLVMPAMHTCAHRQTLFL